MQGVRRKSRAAEWGRWRVIGVVVVTDKRPSHVHVFIGALHGEEDVVRGGHQRAALCWGVAGGAGAGPGCSTSCSACCCAQLFGKVQLRKLLHLALLLLLLLAQQD